MGERGEGAHERGIHRCWENIKRGKEELREGRREVEREYEYEEGGASNQAHERGRQGARQ